MDSAELLRGDAPAVFKSLLSERRPDRADRPLTQKPPISG
jgi:hypothetical protein